MNGDDIYQGLLDRGYAPPQAAALTGNMLQESGGNPAALNDKEGAHGLLQWRLDRWQGLQDYAKAQGADPSDPNTQLDYIKVEGAGPEKRSYAPFLAAPDVASANAALKGYIRYGDNSQATRLANAQGFLKGGGATAPMSMAGPQPAAQSAPAAPAPAQAPPQAVPSAPAAAPFSMAALAATPQLQNILPRTPNPFGLKIAPFSLGG